MDDLRNIRINLGEIDQAQLETEDGCREVAWALMPDVLRQIGQQAAEAMWEGLQQAFDVPGFKVNRSNADRRQFIENAGQEFCDQNLGNKEIEDLIVQRLIEIRDGTDVE